jgi:hypothetical protein
MPNQLDRSAAGANPLGCPIITSIIDDDDMVDEVWHGLKRGSDQRDFVVSGHDHGDGATFDHVLAGLWAGDTAVKPCAPSR